MLNTQAQVCTVYIHYTLCIPGFVYMYGTVGYCSAHPGFVNCRRAGILFRGAAGGAPIDNIDEAAIMLGSVSEGHAVTHLAFGPAPTIRWRWMATSRWREWSSVVHTTAATREVTRRAVWWLHPGTRSRRSETGDGRPQ